MADLLRADPQLVSTLVPLLPPGLGLSETSSVEEIIPVISTPQFTDAIDSLDHALRTSGLPPSMMRDIGLPESAGQGLRQFLQALKALSREIAQDDGMDQD
jgi:hypothetical protein